MEAPFDVWVKLLPVVIDYMELHRYDYVVIGGVAFHLLTGEEISTKDLDFASPNIPVTVSTLSDFSDFLKRRSFNVLRAVILYVEGQTVLQILVAVEPPYRLGIEIFPEIYGRSLYHVVENVRLVNFKNRLIRVVSPNTFVVLTLAKPNGLSDEDFQRVTKIIEHYELSAMDIARKVIEMKLGEVVRANIKDLRGRGLTHRVLSEVTSILDCKSESGGDYSRIVRLRELVISYALGKLSSKDFTEMVNGIGFNGRALLELIERTFKELDSKKWLRLLRAHPYSIEAFEAYWRVHGRPKVVERAPPLEVEGIRDVDVVVWVAKEISCT